MAWNTTIPFTCTGAEWIFIILGFLSVKYGVDPEINQSKKGWFDQIN